VVTFHASYKLKAVVQGEVSGAQSSASEDS
jgi:hypothetical protein